MLESVFTRVFSYRQGGNKTPLENFLTEVFAFCLEIDETFRHDFMKNILTINLSLNNFEIVTQKEYKNYGRPDIEINFDDTTILVESKIEASERINQLKDYASILIKQKTHCQNKHIVFLTKYFEHKEFSNKQVVFHLIRWFEIYELINENNKEITQQLKIFLNEQNMETVKNFTIQDLLAMKSIAETITKMDELLDAFKPVFETQFGGYSKDSSRSTRLSYEDYTNSVRFKYQKNDYTLFIGFFWWDDDEIPQIGICILIPKKKFENSDLIRILEKKLPNIWETWEYEGGHEVYFAATKPISEFIAQGVDNIPAMKKYIDGNLKILYDLRKKYPKLFKK